MSGGHFNYSYATINYIADEIQVLIDTNNTRDEYGYSRGYSAETINEFKSAIASLKKSAIYAQRIDWLVSGDDGEETFHERLKKDLEGDKVIYLKPGDKVTYTFYIKEKGIVSSISPEGIIFVVFNCGNDWEHYHNYTGQSVRHIDLKLGWPKEEEQSSEM